MGDAQEQKEALLQRQAQAREAKRGEDENKDEENEEAETKAEAESPPAPLRENMVSNAVKFLSNENVAKSPLVRKVAFLESKGLTNEEITEALRRVGQGGADSTSAPSAPAISAPSGNAVAPPPVPVRIEYIPPPPAPASGSTFRTVATAVVLTLGAVGGGAWLVNSFLRRALDERLGKQPLPTVETPATPMSPAAPSRELLDTQVVQSNTSLQRSMSELMEVMKTQQSEVKDTLKMVHTVLHTPEKPQPSPHTPSWGDQINVNQLTSAITELHSLLKNANLASTPSAPSSSSVSMETKQEEAVDESYLSSPLPRSRSPPTATTPLQAAAPLDQSPVPTRSFAEVMKMVQAGEQPPNVKQIDDSPLRPHTPLSASTTEKPLKPWEKRRKARTTQTKDSPRELPSYLSQFKDTGKKEQELVPAPLEPTPLQESQGEIVADDVPPLPSQSTAEDVVPEGEVKEEKVEEVISPPSSPRADS